MEYYCPLLPNGYEAPISWEIRLFHLNVNWPIKENASTCMRIYNRFMIVAGFLMCCYLNEAEIHFMVENINDIGLIFELVPLYLILVESHLRIFRMVYSKVSFKELLDEFFQKIYIENTPANRQIFRNIERKLLPTKICSYSYLLTLVTYLVIPLIGFFNHKLLIPYKTIFHYNIDKWYTYVPTLALSIWIGVAVASHLVAESNLLATFILHLNARYLGLQEDLHELEKKVSQDMKISSDNCLKEYRRRLVTIIKRNVEYNEFAHKLKKQYSFSIFVMMSFSAVLLCALGFELLTIGINTKIIGLVTWILAKILELLVFGFLGSQLIDTTNQISTSYYSCNWENIIFNSRHTRNNIELMKLIILAIELNQNPICLTGYNYFNVSISTVISILQGAFSYFTFLCAFR